jgi:hypothetical protein
MVGIVQCNLFEARQSENRKYGALVASRRLDYQLRRGRAFAAAKSIMAIRRPNTM